MFLLSLPMRERGLKSCTSLFALDSRTSLPMRERGLKFFLLVNFPVIRKVAPHAGAWIEMMMLIFPLLDLLSLPMRERGLKSTSFPHTSHLGCRSPCGSVD